MSQCKIVIPNYEAEMEMIKVLNYITEKTNYDCLNTILSNLEYCDDCNIFVDPKEVEEHKNSHPIFCTGCKKFIEKRQYRNYHRYTCGQFNDFKCVFCNYYFEFKDENIEFINNYDCNYETQSESFEQTAYIKCPKCDEDLNVFSLFDSNDGIEFMKSRFYRIDLTRFDTKNFSFL